VRSAKKPSFVGARSNQSKRTPTQRLMAGSSRQKEVGKRYLIFEQLFDLFDVHFGRDISDEESG
jgi:hypothetical protein